MAAHANSTTAPARPLLPHRGPDGRFAKRQALPAAADVLAEISAEIDRQEAARAELPPEPLLSAADRARALHLRRQLEAAAEHGVAFLSALGLPRLVGPNFMQVDPAAAGDALDLAIATLDALDGDADIEDGADDEFTGDDELSLGWTAKVDQVHLGQDQDDYEVTALERHGRGFFRSGPDDPEDGHDAEQTYEDGSEDEPHPWRFDRPDAVQRTAHLCEVPRLG